ncbi:hypothetical protein [Nonomuraea sp. NPDC003804]|uniref:hypothetical protein n=1 Tax=Nonomuraea sp. NPDC003804 TaxID=3154547 RepID=UPI0033B5F89C
MMPRALPILAAVLIGAGAVAGFVPVSAQGVGCGSAFVAGNAPVEADYRHVRALKAAGLPMDVIDPYAAACRDARGRVLLPATALLGAGAAGLLAGQMLARRRVRRGTPR